MMTTLQDQKVIVTGGSRGLGLGIVEALVEQKARVTVVARNAAPLEQVSRRLGVHAIQGDITDRELAAGLLREIRPSVLVLNAGATPVMGSLLDLTWAEFSGVWDVDVKAGLQWVQEALRLPLPRGSQVILSSSGAALAGSPLSGGYAGAKRMLWMLASYANTVSQRLNLDLRFKALIPQQMIGETELGHSAASAYAAQKGISVETFLDGFGARMPPRKVGEHVVSILTDPRHRTGVAFGIKGDHGIVSLDGN
ncbi:MAG TPA: SDR family NAD(P)-dependent oxidoreductase [Polyangiaceae bacterium]|nr:SDR family NAD(P)-dependent oxidoreductase [Polyangiaceae bacterium]